MVIRSFKLSEKSFSQENFQSSKKIRPILHLTIIVLVLATLTLPDPFSRQMLAKGTLKRVWSTDCCEWCSSFSKTGWLLIGDNLLHPETILGHRID